MIVNTRQIRVISEALDPDKLIITMGLWQAYAESTRNFEVHYDDILLADGYINLNSNRALISMHLDNESNHELEDFLVKTIQSGNY
jgi:hypothetical protein